MNEFEARREALLQALLHAKPNEKPEVSVARADIYFAFLSNMTSGKRPAAKTVAAQAPAAPRKRGRPRKVA